MQSMRATSRPTRPRAASSAYRPGTARSTWRWIALRWRKRRPFAQQNKSRRGAAAAALMIDREEVSVLGRPGSDLLFQALRLSTIGAGEFNGRVRDGIGYRLPANTTRPAKDGMKQAVFHFGMRIEDERDQAQTSD